MIIRFTQMQESQNSKTDAFSAFLSSSIAQSCLKTAREPLSFTQEPLVFKLDGSLPRSR